MVVEPLAVVADKVARIVQSDILSRLGILGHADLPRNRVDLEWLDLSHRDIEGPFRGADQLRAEKVGLFVVCGYVSWMTKAYSIRRSMISPEGRWAYTQSADSLPRSWC